MEISDFEKAEKKLYWNIIIGKYFTTIPIPDHKVTKEKQK